MASTVVTNAWLAKVADALQSGSFAFDAAYFRIGEGGWQTVAGAQVVRSPDATLTNLDCVVNASRYPSGGRYWFQKSLSSARVVEVTAYSVRIECLVDVDEANDDDGTGVAPEFWELGVYDSAGTMISHTTFDRQPKTSSVALRHFITIQLARG
jgi:hypothetical protein